MERHRAAAVRDDELELREILEQIRQDELHERHGVGVEVVRAGGVQRRIAAAGDVDHRRHVELDHLLVERIPPLVGERRRVEVAARRIGIEVAADEAELLHAALELLDRGGRRHARRLRQLAHADEVLREQRADAVDQVVADLRPFLADREVADVVAHAGGARREDREVGAALALQLELVRPRCCRGSRRRDILRPARGGSADLVLDRLGLVLAEAVQVLGLGRVVAVTIDDHDTFAVDDGREPDRNASECRTRPVEPDATNRASPCQTLMFRADTRPRGLPSWRCL